MQVAGGAHAAPRTRQAITGRRSRLRNNDSRMGCRQHQSVCCLPCHPAAQATSQEEQGSECNAPVLKRCPCAQQQSSHRSHASVAEAVVCRTRNMAASMDSPCVVSVVRVVVNSVPPARGGGGVVPLCGELARGRVGRVTGRCT